MLNNYECDSVAEFYNLISDSILGVETIDSRNGPVKEILCPNILIKNPRNRMAFNPIRKWNLSYAMIEAIMLFQNVNDLKFFSYQNKNMVNYSDDGLTLYGAYGSRVAQYIPDIINKLINDKNSRQASITVLQNYDVAKNTKDMPCTLSLQFLVRDNQLNMIVNMRSNDIFLGLPYDIFMFTTMQEIMFNTLKDFISGLKLGWYLHRPASLHLYQDNFDIFERTSKSFKNIEISFPETYLEWMSYGKFYISAIKNKE